MAAHGLTVACVRTGTKYGNQYVERLRNGVARHLHRPYRFVCLTDQPERIAQVEYEPIGDLQLPGWWAKMYLFAHNWRYGQRVIFLDLDMVICSDIGKLAEVTEPFAICDNFTRRAGGHWPCRYSSACMVFNPELDSGVWERFEQNRRGYIKGPYEKYGDQRIIELLYPNAALLQPKVGEHFFLHYRWLTRNRPANVAVVVFAGRNKPDNTAIDWVKREWY